MTASAKGTADEPGRNVSQKAGLNREILDRGWGELARQLDYKLRWASRRRGAKKLLLRACPAHTSQTCHSCRHVDAASRPSQARFACTACGHTDHADRNAARNIRERGLIEIARACGLAIEDLPEALVTPPDADLSGASYRDDTAGGSPGAASGGIGHRAPETPHLDHQAGRERNTTPMGHLQRLQDECGSAAPT